MSTKKKTGKTRLDKYYYLAKDHGYRARSAFKLIQINQTYNILSNVHSVVDLCAAPGSWLQVVSKVVKPPSKVVGVDLDPIKPIYGVETIMGDITEELTQIEILRAANSTEVDVVLHDGAPNVGTSWEKDSYVQNELVCHAAKLACQLLKKNGVFVTKVFRSKDFNSIVWMCNQLFEECLTTKPRSSRDESAEVFLVCRGYKKPEVLDEKFFDPQFIFADQEDEPAAAPRALSAVLRETIIDLTGCPKVTIDCMEQMIDEETRILLGDLLVVNEMDRKRLIRTLRKVQRAYIGRISGNQPEEVLDLRTPVEKQQSEMEQIKKAMVRREKILQRKILAKRTKRLGLTEQDIEEIENIHGDFFEDNIFDNEDDSSASSLSLKESESEPEHEPEDASEDQNDSDADSCSSSLNLEDKVVGYRLKEDEEEFENDGIDRYVYDDEPHLPQFFKDDEAKYNRRYVFNKDKEHWEGKVSKKELEIKNRRARRVDRKLAKIKERLSQTEQEVDLRAIKKGAIKKEARERPKMVFAGPSKSVPRMKGRIKMTDRRMKKDKAGIKRAEQRKQRKR